LRFNERAPARRLLKALLGIGALTAMASLLTACGGNSARSAVNATNGVCAGVCLSFSTSTNQLQQGANFVIAASVANDPNAQGVTWQLNGIGALSNITTTSVTYTAPTGVTGTAAPTIVATSVANTTQYAQSAIVVLGTPVLEATTLFPANVSSAYTAELIVDGGLGPFTWSMPSGALPAGITLGTSTTGINTLSGTPTATGTYTFTLQVVDANSATTTLAYTMTVNGAAACVLNGQYALLVTGFALNAYTVGAASLNVTSAGTVTGFQDYTYGTANVAESLTGTCTTRAANNGTLNITGATAHSPQYDFAVTSGLANGRVQLINGQSNESASGPFLQQDTTAFALTTLAGSYAFGALGMQSDGTRAAVTGTLTFDATGNVTAGRLDSNTTTALSAAPATGSLSAPDSVTGRGTLQLSAGGQSLTFSYYVINANKLLIVSAAPPASAPRLAGFVTRQSGAFDNTSLATPTIMTLWGGTGAAPPPSILSLGRLSNANAAAGMVDLVLDTANQATGSFSVPVPGGGYAVSADGRTTLSFTSAGTTHQFVAYLDGPSNGYLLEVGGTSGSAGLLEAQSPGPFSASIPGLFVSGTQFGEDAGPMVLLPAVSLSAAGQFSSTYATGSYSLDTVAGHGLGTLSVTGAGNGVFTSYIVSPTKVRVLRQGALGRSGAIEWLGSN